MIDNFLLEKYGESSKHDENDMDCDMTVEPVKRIEGESKEFFLYLLPQVFVTT